MRDMVGENNTCLEKECKIEFQGKSFESGGAFIGIDKNGKHGGCVYGDYNFQTVSNWHGDIKINAHYGREFRSNMGDKRRHIWFNWKGMRFHGVWAGIDWSQIVRVREIK